MAGLRGIHAERAAAQTESGSKAEVGAGWHGRLDWIDALHGDRLEFSGGAVMNDIICRHCLEAVVNAVERRYVDHRTGEELDPPDYFCPVCGYLIEEVEL